MVDSHYSNAVLKVVLPIISDAAKSLKLPLPCPITEADIAGVHFLPFLDRTFSNPSVSIMLRQKWVFSFQDGYICLIENANGYSSLQDPAQIPSFYGENKMSKDEAIRFARNVLKNLGIPLRDVFANYQPDVITPELVGTNTIPYYRIGWIDPRNGQTCCEVGINAHTKRTERVMLSCKGLEKPMSQIAVVPASAPLEWPPTNPEYARQLIPIMLKAIDEYAKTLELPIPSPLSVNNVTKIRISDNGGWPDCDVELTNGWRFVYRHAMVNGFYSPNVLLTDIHFRPIKVENYLGKWNLTTNRAIDLVKTQLARLNYPTNNIHVEFAPRAVFAAGNFRQIIPRYYFEWLYKNPETQELQSKVEAEVDANNGKIESLYYDDLAFWGSNPPINVPITIK